MSATRGMRLSIWHPEPAWPLQHCQLGGQFEDGDLQSRKVGSAFGD